MYFLVKFLSKAAPVNAAVEERKAAAARSGVAAGGPTGAVWRPAMAEAGGARGAGTLNTPPCAGRTCRVRRSRSHEIGEKKYK